MIDFKHILVERTKGTKSIKAEKRCGKRLGYTHIIANTISDDILLFDLITNAPVDDLRNHEVVKYVCQQHIQKYEIHSVDLFINGEKQ